MKISVAAAAFVGVTLLVGGQAAYSLVGDELTDTPSVTDPTVTEEPEVDEPEVEDPETDTPETDEPEVEEPETEEPESESETGGPEAAAAHREAMAAWKDCVDAAVEAAPEATEPIDVLTLCGTKPHPPGKANGWDGEKVSKSAQKKVDRAAGVAKEPKEKSAKPEKAAKAPKAKKGKGHQR
ncbi:MAG TPA: hypothetical protein VLI04_00820 [Nocardioidaceae bacterium]|nr:hypothetical protein [Nocardioidaceae bacterium]